MNKVKGYRNMMNERQQDWADLLGIKRPTYNRKEIGKTQFNDKEKKIIRDHISKVIPDITIDELFFWLIW